MVTSIATAGFLLAAIAYSAVAAVLLLGWRSGGRSRAPLLAVGAAIVWAGLMAWSHAEDFLAVQAVAAVDAVRLAGWSGLLLSLLATIAPGRVFRALLGVVALAVGTLLAVASTPWWPGGAAWAGMVFVIGGIIGALVVLVLIEQIYRNAGDEARWSLKYLCLGLGAVFGYDLFLFADALLGQRPDTGFWAARGYINALVAPLIAVSAARNPGWSLDVYVSRRFVLHTATLALAGGYLILMALVAYSIQVYGGAWAGPVQAVFLVGSVLVLAVLLFSGQMRARARIFLSKHFYNYRYDYREEWLRFSRTMTAGEADARPLPERAIQAIAQVVDSPGGVLWHTCDGQLEPVASWNLPEPAEAVEPLDGDLARFLAETEWVLTAAEWRQHPERYRGIAMPDWLAAMPRFWLVVPLLHHERLEGVVVLARSRAGEPALNWEDFDLLKIIGRQVASYLAQDAAARALSRAEQFATFNRLSAFVLHDLKNIIGQLSMLARNARRHGDSPEFMRDAVATIEHSVERMNQLMTQLRGGAQTGATSSVDLVRVVHSVVEARAAEQPVPVAEAPTEPVRLHADRARLTSVLSNLVQNAQEATADHGSVRLVLSRDADGATLDISDTGVGMDRAFVRERLFHPFDTSKGQTGMGIGAFEAREFVRGLGGTVSVASTPGEGTRFRLHFPVSCLVERPSSVPMEEET